MQTTLELGCLVEVGFAESVFVCKLVKWLIPAKIAKLNPKIAERNCGPTVCNSGEGDAWSGTCTGSCFNEDDDVESGN